MKLNMKIHNYKRTAKAAFGMSGIPCLNAHFICGMVRVAKRLALLTSDYDIPGWNPTGGETQLMILLYLTTHFFFYFYQSPVVHKLNNHITKTYLYIFDSLKPHFYIVKLRFTGVYISFLISVQKHSEYPQSMF